MTGMNFPKTQKSIMMLSAMGPAVATTPVSQNMVSVPQEPEEGKTRETRQQYRARLRREAKGRWKGV